VPPEMPSTVQPADEASNVPVPLSRCVVLAASAQHVGVTALTLEVDVVICVHVPPFFLYWNSASTLLCAVPSHCSVNRRRKVRFGRMVPEAGLTSSGAYQP
jgi:hypothetical protein